MTDSIAILSGTNLKNLFISESCTESGELVSTVVAEMEKIISWLSNTKKAFFISNHLFLYTIFGITGSTASLRNSSKSS